MNEASKRYVTSVLTITTQSFRHDELLSTIFNFGHWFFRTCKILCVKFRAAVLLLTALGCPFLSYLSFNMVLEPGLSTLRAQFHPADCAVVLANKKKGKYNCSSSWSSCKVGCTQNVLYICWEVIVAVVDRSDQQHSEHSNLLFYQTMNDAMSVVVQTSNKVSNIVTKSWLNKRSRTYLGSSAPAKLYLFPNLTNVIKKVREKPAINLTSRHLVRFQVNALGCSYESCEEWYALISKKNRPFSCFVSDVKNIAVEHVNCDEARRLVFLGVLPLVLSLISILLIYCLYCRNGAKDFTISLQSNPEQQKQRRDEARLRMLKELSQRSNGPQETDMKILLRLVKPRILPKRKSKCYHGKRINTWINKTSEPSKNNIQWRKAIQTLMSSMNYKTETPRSSTLQKIHTIAISSAEDQRNIDRNMALY